MRLRDDTPLRLLPCLRLRLLMPPFFALLPCLLSMLRHLLFRHVERRRCRYDIYALSCYAPCCRAAVAPALFQLLLPSFSLIIAVAAPRYAMPLYAATLLLLRLLRAAASAILMLLICLAPLMLLRY